MAEVVGLAEGIASIVRDGDTVALEGFTHLIPVRAGHEIIRQGRRDLTLVRMTPDIVYDQLIGAGCARKLVFSWGGNPGVGSLHRLRDAVENGWPGPAASPETSSEPHAAPASMAVANRSAASWRRMVELHPADVRMSHARSQRERRTTSFHRQLQRR